MKIFNDLTDISHIETPLAIALGTFDGIHIGHRTILEGAAAEARHAGIQSGCYCFSNIPKEFLSSRAGENPNGIFRLCSEDEKMELLNKIGFDFVFSVPFDEQTMSVSADFFVKNILIEKLNAKVICCGFNYTFGRNAEGNTARLTSIASQHGARVKVYDPVYLDGVLVSSTAIRNYIKSGDLTLAHRMLGR